MMIFRSWHIPAGVIVSFLAHIGIVSLLVAGAKWSNTGNQLVPKARSIKAAPSAMETYPTFSNPVKEEQKPEPNLMFQEKVENEDVSEPLAVHRPLEKPPAPRYPPPAGVSEAEMEARFPALFK